MQLFVYKLIVIGEVVTGVREGHVNVKVMGAGALMGILGTLVLGIICCFVQELRVDSEKN